MYISPFKEYLSINDFGAFLLKFLLYLNFVDLQFQLSFLRGQTYFNALINHGLMDKKTEDKIYYRHQEININPHGSNEAFGLSASQVFVSLAYNVIEK